MRHTIFTLSAFVVAIMLAPGAQASVFDFESLSSGTYTSVTQTVGGVSATFHAASGTFDITDSTGFAGFGNHSLLNFYGGTGPTYADFSSAVSDPSIQSTDYTPSDTDNLYLAAYSGADGTGTLLGTAYSGPCCDTNSIPVTMSLNVSGVRSVAFYSLSTDPYPGSTYYDNLTVNSAVPEPATWAMTVMGFAGLGFIARRRAKQHRSEDFSAA